MKKKNLTKKKDNIIEFEKWLPIYVIAILVCFYFHNKIIGLNNKFTISFMIISFIIVAVYKKMNILNLSLFLNYLYASFAFFSIIFSFFFVFLYFSKDEEETYIYCEIIKFKKYGKDGLIYKYNGNSYSNNFQDRLIYNRDNVKYDYRIKGNKSKFNTFIKKSGKIVISRAPSLPHESSRGGIFFQKKAI